MIARSACRLIGKHILIYINTNAKTHKYTQSDSYTGQQSLQCRQPLALYKFNVLVAPSGVYVYMYFQTIGRAFAFYSTTQISSATLIFISAIDSCCRRRRYLYACLPISRKAPKIYIHIYISIPIIYMYTSMYMCSYLLWVCVIGMAMAFSLFKIVLGGSRLWLCIFTYMYMYLFPYVLYILPRKFAKF